METPVLEVVNFGDKAAVVVGRSPFYAEMGGQLGDTGTIFRGGEIIPVMNTQKSGNTWLHFVPADANIERGAWITARIDPERRAAISRHHSVTHLLHWALHEVVSPDAIDERNAGRFAGPIACSTLPMKVLVPNRSLARSQSIAFFVCAR